MACECQGSQLTLSPSIRNGPQIQSKGAIKSKFYFLYKTHSQGKVVAFSFYVNSWSVFLSYVFRPNIESMSMRFAMMKAHRPTTGEVVAFDGSILFLPMKLKDVSDYK